VVRFSAALDVYLGGGPRTVSAGEMIPKSKRAGAQDTLGGRQVLELLANLQVTLYL
jgi:hypothetical protein